MTPKQIEEMNKLAYSYEYKEHRNCYGCCQVASDYEDAFKAGYKAAMEKAKVLEDALEFVLDNYLDIVLDVRINGQLERKTTGRIEAKKALKQYRGEG